MSKLYLFLIGGTGSRVLRSLDMLLAAGVPIRTDAIVPIVIDPDEGNADLTRTYELTRLYTQIYSRLDHTGDEVPYFRTELSEEMQNYRFQVDGTQTLTFEQFVDISSMSRPNQVLMKLLFSEKNLKSEMDVGFKGNPNIGSVVLSQIFHSTSFTSFANQFTQGDKIFIVSSIFGGTGSSGFPLLLKMLRHSEAFDNHALINGAPIGAVTLLPYFRVKTDPESEIDSSTFISKTKAALKYYEDNTIGELNAFYTLGDVVAESYDNNEGGPEQKNDAHLMEFLAATAIIDFLRNTPGTRGGGNRDFAIKETGETVTFASFHRSTLDLLYKPLVSFTLMANAHLDRGERLTSTDFNAWNNFTSLDPSFVGDLEEFFAKYREWLGELAGNKRPLVLFNNNCGDKPFELVCGKNPKKLCCLSKKDYNLFEDRLNSAYGKTKSKLLPTKYLEMYARATEELIKKMNLQA